MKIKYRDNSSEFTRFHYDKDENKFVITSSNPEDDSELLYFPVLHLDEDETYPIANFSYQLFNNEHSTENSIYQVYVDKKRIGWIFPIQALLSCEHDYSDDVYFLKYAYVATVLLLQNLSDRDRIDSPDEFLLQDYVNSNKCILVIDHQNLSKVEATDISDYMVSFFKYGYEITGNGNSQPLPIVGTKRMKVRPLAKDLRGNEHINYLFEEQFPSAETPVIRFHLCYQIIELLISRVFDHKFQTIIGKLSLNPENLFDLKDDFTKITGEKERVKCLFEDYSSCDRRDIGPLQAACEKFLTQNGKKVNGNYYYDLYSVRCLLVHKLYSIKKESYQQLDDINRPFLNIVIDMVLSFHMPDSPA